MYHLYLTATAFLRGDNHFGFFSVVESRQLFSIQALTRQPALLDGESVLPSDYYSPTSIASHVALRPRDRRICIYSVSYHVSAKNKYICMESCSRGNEYHAQKLSHFVLLLYSDNGKSVSYNVLWQHILDARVRCLVKRFPCPQMAELVILCSKFRSIYLITDFPQLNIFLLLFPIIWDTKNCQTVFKGYRKVTEIRNKI